MMKNILFIALIGLFLLGCNDSAPIKVEENPSKKPKTGSRKEAESLIAHSEDRKTKTSPTVEKSKEKKKWTRSGNPIDTSKLDSAVEKAEKDLKSTPDKGSVKSALSDAYYKRGFVLTEARQYAAAIGDFRRALKHNPENAEAKKWISVILNIYKSINREAPKEGEEPAALEFKKDKA